MDRSKAKALLSAISNRNLWAIADSLGSEAPFGGKKPWQRENKDALTARVLKAGLRRLDDVVEVLDKEDLAQLCTDHGLAASGTKASLADRLIDFVNRTSASGILKAQEDALEKILGGNDEDGQGLSGAGTSDDEPEHDARFQGRREHRELQQALVELAEIRGCFARTNVSIGAGFRPDVLWYRLDPDEHPNVGFSYVFEIEFGTSAAVSKSLASLKHAHDLGCSKLFLFVPPESLKRVESKAGLELRQGAFHEIAQELNIIGIEEGLTNHHFLAKKLKI